MRLKRKLGIVAALLVAAEMTAPAAWAEVQVEGAPNAVHIEVRHSPLRQVLDAMQARFNLRYRTNDALDTPITGTFDGPLRRVAARVLEGYDFAMTVTSEGIDVLVLRQNQQGPVVAVLPAEKPARPRAMTAQEANRRERGLVK
ncbi:hypothetical protein ACFFWD_30180 [Bradyrhizobium erythrophlei]|uniref:hypothetical protein n=1 Tax=Bradyrhizobium erythrophlei TaxID=1437360 RepID=UPI0035E50F08